MCDLTESVDWKMPAVFVITTAPGGLTHRGVFEAAGEGDAAALPAVVELGAVEVDVGVPVVGPVGSAARPLGTNSQRLDGPERG